MKKVSELPNHYTSIEDLTLYRWDKYTTTKDSNWFLVDYDGRQKKIECEGLKEVENALIDEYFKAVDDRFFASKMQKWSKIDWLKTKYSTCHFLLNELSFTIQLELNTEAKEHILYLSERRYKIVQELKKWNLKFPELNSLQSDLDLIGVFRTVLDGIKTQIGMLSNELQKDGQKESKALYEQIAIAKTALPGYEMNPRIMVVAEWIAIHKLLEEKAKKN